MAPLSRRTVLMASPGLAVAACAHEHQTATRVLELPKPHTPVSDIHQRVKSPVVIDSVELLHRDNNWFIRTRSGTHEGVALCNHRTKTVASLLKDRVLPFFANKNARDLEQLVDQVYTYRSNYKFAGLAFWVSVGMVEFSLMDLLGKVAGVPVARLLGPIRRNNIPIYLSSLRRDTTPEQEVDWILPRIEATGARAVKIKIGGRMSNNRDAAPGRTDALVPLARKTFGDGVELFVDANGSYDATHAVQIGHMLQAHGVGFFEEPCPFEDFESLRRVAQALEIPIAGGEQDGSYDKFEWMVRNGALDLVQPDLSYNGGFIRCARVGRLAAAAGIPITPHAPQSGYHALYMMHFAAATPNIGPFQEFRAEAAQSPSWHEPLPPVTNGEIALPKGPGLGVAIDPDYLTGAEVVWHSDNHA